MTLLLLTALLALQAPDELGAEDKGFVRVEPSSPAPDERRVALVIGNARYEAISQLNNPTADTRLLATSLRRVGFDVVEAHDLDRDAMLRAIREFGRKMKGADVAFFYFSGHGLQQEGRAYMVPTSARIRVESDIELEAVDVGRMLARMEDGGGGRTNLIFLDACRNNPIPRQTRAPVAGLASIDAPVGSLIAYATAPGRTASDGRGANSPFAEALAEEMLTPGAPIETVMKRVRVRVQRASGGGQIPWQSSSLTRDFYFVPAGAEPARPGAVQPPHVAMGPGGLGIRPDNAGTASPEEASPGTAAADRVGDEVPPRRRRRSEGTFTSADEGVEDSDDDDDASVYDYTWADYGYYGAFGAALATWPACGVFVIGGLVGWIPAALFGPALSSMNLAWITVLLIIPPLGCMALSLLMPFFFVASLLVGGCLSVVRMFVDRDGPMPPSLQGRRDPATEGRPPLRQAAVMAF